MSIDSGARPAVRKLRRVRTQLYALLSNGDHNSLLDIAVANNGQLGATQWARGRTVPRHDVAAAREAEARRVQVRPRRVQDPGLETVCAEGVAALLHHAQGPLWLRGEVAQAHGARRVEEGALEGRRVSDAWRDAL